MQGLLLVITGAILGAAASTLVTLCITGRAGPVAIPEDAAILFVRPPGKADPASTGLDEIWERQIRTHVQLIRERVGAALTDVDVVHHTQWYSSFSDTDSRFDALKEAVHVESVPGTSLIVLSVESRTPEDSRTIANALVTAYVNGLRSERDRQASREAEKLYSNVASLRREEEVREWDVARTDDSTDVERAIAEIASIRSHRLELERELDSLRRDSDDPTREEIVVLRTAHRTDEE